MVQVFDFCVIEYAQIEIEIGIEFVISFGEIIQLACQQAVTIQLVDMLTVLCLL